MHCQVESERHLQEPVWNQVDGIGDEAAADGEAEELQPGR